MHLRYLHILLHNPYLLLQMTRPHHHNNPSHLTFFKNKEILMCQQKKLYFSLFSFQEGVDLQLCCSLMIISFSENPASTNTCITLNPNGTTCPCFLISPIRIAQYFFFFNTLKLSFATSFIA